LSDYLRRKWAELDARKAGNAGTPAEPQPAREARRRGVEAAIARGEEPTGRFEGIAAVLPPSVQAAAGIPVRPPRILKADVPDSIPRKTPKTSFMPHVRVMILSVLGRGVSKRCLEDVAEAVVILERDRGFTWAGLKSIATVSRYCVRHVWRALRLLIAAGLFHFMHVPYREGDEWWRDANIYVATMDEEPAPVPADVDAPDPVVPASVSRELGGGARLAALFGLVLRADGLNTSAATNYRTRPRPA
jgi:hypothetical protein